MARMARRKAHEEHSNHEAWAIPYADLMTLLLAFFVVMYAISTLNEGKYRVLADALTAAFGGAPRTINPVQVGNQQMQGSDFDRPSPIKSGAKSGPSAPSPAPNPTLLPSLASHLRVGQPMPISEHAALQRSQRQLGAIATELEQALGPLIDANLITVRRAELWLEVEINSDILFATGSAALGEEARVTLSKVAAVLADMPNPVRVEGYTDDRPIRTAQFPSNWELSAARAASVVHLFVGHDLEPERLAMVGFGEYRLRAENTTPEGRSRNRRVVIVVLGVQDDVPRPGMVVRNRAPDSDPAPSVSRAGDAAAPAMLGGIQ